MLMQHLKEDGFPEVEVSRGRLTDIDALAASDEPARRFLNAAWFRAHAPRCEILRAGRSGEDVLLALPFVDRKAGPLRVREVAGGYWPYRSFPVAQDAGNDELVAFLRDRETARALGRIWRLGPVYSDDPTARRLLRAAPEAGWTVLRRSIATCFELDLAALRSDGEWPKPKTARKNRWRERRLAADGELRYAFLTGADWTASDRDAIATVEARSWLAKLDDGGDTKFLDPATRKTWERMAEDEHLASMMFASLMWVGDRPAAFTFGIEAGDTRYYIANNYDEDFSKFGPGKVLLYHDFARAADNGIRRISWGAGDAGYKSEMGAEPGPEILDLLFVRGRMRARLIEPLFMRGANG